MLEAIKLVLSFLYHMIFLMKSFSWVKLMNAVYLMYENYLLSHGLLDATLFSQMTLKMLGYVLAIIREGAVIRKTWMKDNIYFFLSFDGHSFTSKNESQYDHTFVSTLGSYRGNPFITGCWNSNESNHKKTEIFQQSTQQWIEETEFPFASR